MSWRRRTCFASASRTSSRHCRPRWSARPRPGTSMPRRRRTRATSSSARPTCAGSCGPMSLPPAERRVAEYVEQHELLRPGEPVLALVSGGPDSLCLWGVLRELGYAVDALHVEHGLRGEAGLADAAYCAALGAQVAAVDVASGGNMEARAREARYAAARERADSRPIATGHTLSDQAETVVYRLSSS